MYMKEYESPRCEWEMMKMAEVLCGSLEDVSGEDYSDGGNYEW